DCNLFRICKAFEIWRYIDIQKFPVDEQEPFCIRQAGKLRKIVRLNLCQPRWTNLGHARCFVQGKIACTPRFFELFTDSFDSHDGGWRLNGSVKVDKNLARFSAFAGTQNTALLQNIKIGRAS